MTGEAATIRRETFPFARRPAVPVAICFVVGIALHDHVFHNPYLWLSATAACGIAALLIRPHKVGDVMLMLAMVTIGIALAQIEAFYYPANHISAYATDEQRLAWLELNIDHEPRILTDPFSPRPMPPKQVITAAITRVRTWNGWVDCSGEILVQIAQPHPGLAIHQHIRVLGKLERPAPAMNPGQFNWAGYYRDQRILASLHVVSAQNITILSTDRSGPLDYLRQRARQLLAAGFTSDRSLDHSLLRALLLGDSDPELRDIQEQFRHTGTSYHLSISGMHIAVLAGFVYLICRLLRVRPNWSLVIGMVFTVFYGLIALPSVPVVRSVSLCIFFGIAMLARRRRNAVQLLSLSILGMLVYHPTDLYNAGFQLGVLTVLALMIFGRSFLTFMRGLGGEEPFDPHRKRTLPRRVADRLHSGLTDAFYIGLLAWVVSMPLIVYHFNQINPWAIVGGIILAPFVFTSLIAGLLKVILTALWPSLAGPTATMAAAPTALMRHVLHWLTFLPGSEFPVPSIPLWAMLIVYALFLLALIPSKKPKLRILLRSGPALACILALVSPFARGKSSAAPEELTLTLLSVGAGQCAIVDAPSGRTLVVDAGSSTLADPLGKCISPFLRSTGHTSIDSMLLTHPDYDHICAATGLAQGYGVREVLIGGGFREHARGNAPAEAMLRSLDAMDVPPRTVAPGDHVPLGRGAELEILRAPADANLSSNDSAVVAQLRYAGRSILITGDIQEPAEKALLAAPDQLHADVLIAPHHGSSETTTAAFVRAVSPAYIISSNSFMLSGKQRRFDHLIGEANLYRTHNSGAITVHIDHDGNISVVPYVQRPQ